MCERGDLQEHMFRCGKLNSFVCDNEIPRGSLGHCLCVLFFFFCGRDKRIREKRAYFAVQDIAGWCNIRLPRSVSCSRAIGYID